MKVSVTATVLLLVCCTTCVCAELECKWDDPATGLTMKQGFKSGFLLACRADSTVTISTAIDGAVIESAQLTGKWKKNPFRNTFPAAKLVIEAPTESGPWLMQIKLKAGGKPQSLTVCLFVPFKATFSKKTFGRMTVAGKMLGTYKDPKLSGAEKVKLHPQHYRPPRHFLAITRETGHLMISPDFKLKDLVIPDKETKKRHTEFVPVCYPLLDAMGALKTELTAHGVRGLKFLSIFRTPIHNRRIGSTSFGRHPYGDAMDFYIDSNNDDIMDDLTGDGKVDKMDGLWLVSLIEDLQARKRIPAGGIGVYSFAMSDYRVTMHLDLRGHRATWGYHHNRRGRKIEFAWQSKRFAEKDTAEREEKKKEKKWVAPMIALPDCEPKHSSAK